MADNNTYGEFESYRKFQNATEVFKNTSGAERFFAYIGSLGKTLANNEVFVTHLDIFEVDSPYQNYQIQIELIFQSCATVAVLFEQHLFKQVGHYLARKDFFISGSNI